LTLEGNEIVLAPEDVMVSVQQASDWASADDSGIQIALATKLTPELIQEGMARDLIRHIQQQRKDANLEENQRIAVEWNAGESQEPVLGAIAAWKTTVLTETRADSIESVATPPEAAKIVSLGDVSISLSIRTV
ncbi:MAG TPA: DUF5915 domain-containing protein, partial [Planctomicrobium sp.]|nr:DUF5915 domain-containing protein [Planctomicrobium sp.]